MHPIPLPHPELVGSMTYRLTRLVLSCVALKSAQHVLLSLTEPAPVPFDVVMSSGRFRLTSGPESGSRAPGTAFRLGSGAFESASPSPSYPKPFVTIDPARPQPHLTGPYIGDYSNIKIPKAIADGKSAHPDKITLSYNKEISGGLGALPHLLQALPPTASSSTDPCWPLSMWAHGEGGSTSADATTWARRRSTKEKRDLGGSTSADASHAFPVFMVSEMYV